MTLQAKPGILRLALCALLCMLALQTWEAGHSHDPGVTQVECQVCSSPADTVLPVNAFLPSAQADNPFFFASSLTRGAVNYFCFQSRGPPAIS